MLPRLIGKVKGTAQCSVSYSELQLTPAREHDRMLNAEPNGDPMGA